MRTALLFVVTVVVLGSFSGGSGGHATAQRRRCPAGQSRSADTSGNCCWPGQAWSSARERCVGAPTCPATLVPTAEESCACAAGMEASADTDGHCCWPGQAFARSRAECVGAPTSCPAAYYATPTGCAQLSTCGGGRVASQASQGNCCWPGQAWDTPTQSCTGVATCPTGSVSWAEGRDCRPSFVGRAFAFTCDNYEARFILRARILDGGVAELLYPGGGGIRLAATWQYSDSGPGGLLDLDGNGRTWRFPLSGTEPGHAVSGSELTGGVSVSCVGSIE